MLETLVCEADLLPVLPQIDAAVIEASLDLLDLDTSIKIAGAAAAATSDNRVFGGMVKVQASRLSLEHIRTAIDQGDYSVTDSELQEVKSDYLKGALTAQHILEAQYRKDAHKPPRPGRRAQKGFEEQLAADKENSDGSLPGYVAVVTERLQKSGCGEEFIAALTDPSLSLPEQAGGLEAVSLYGEQSKVEQAIERSKPRFRTRVSDRGLMGGGLFITLSEIFSKDPRAQHLLPEPFDYFSHSANLACSAAAAAVVGLRVVWRTAEARGWSPRKAQAATALGAMSLVTVLNAISETKWGTQFIPFHTTPDPIDFVYGLIGGAAGTAATLPELNEPSEATQ